MLPMTGIYLLRMRHQTHTVAYVRVDSDLTQISLLLYFTQSPAELQKTALLHTRDACSASNHITPQSRCLLNSNQINWQHLVPDQCPWLLSTNVDFQLEHSVCQWMITIGGTTWVY